MFYNILRRTQQQLYCCNNSQLNRNVIESSFNQWRTISTTVKSNTAKGDPSRSNPDSDIEAALEIEANLFNNSSLIHKPIVAAELLRGAKRQQQQKTEVSTTPYKKTAGKKVHVPKQLKIIEDSELGLQFGRLANKDPLLSTLMTSVRSRKSRDKDQQIILEGRRLIQEALMCGLRMHTLIFSQTDQLRLLKDEVAQAQRTTQTKIYKIAHHDLKTWSTLSTPPGLLAVFQRPPSTNGVMASTHKSSLPITVVCDNIREPNNLGSIIRTCAAIPCAKVVVTRGCCDPWESKALRGGCGGHFRMPIVDDVHWENMPFLIPPETADNCCVFIAENNIAKLPRTAVAVDYTDLGYSGAHNVVIIGGESHGVSVDAYKFLETVGDRGKYLNIPLANGIESLNVASALTLILYELKKHINQPEVVPKIK